MAFLQAIRGVHDNVVANIADLRVISLPWLDVNSSECKVVAWKVLGAVHPDDSVTGSCPGKVFKYDVGPPASQRHTRVGKKLPTYWNIEPLMSGRPLTSGKYVRVVSTAMGWMISFM